MITVKFYCVISNNGDGSASAHFYGNKKSAELAWEAEEKSGEGFTDNEPEEVILKFDEDGTLLNPSAVIDYDWL